LFSAEDVEEEIVTKTTKVVEKSAPLAGSLVFSYRGGDRVGGHYFRYIDLRPVQGFGTFVYAPATSVIPPRLKATLQEAAI